MKKEHSSRVCITFFSKSVAMLLVVRLGLKPMRCVVVLLSLARRGPLSALVVT
jgi:hypothetical protein